MWERLRRTTIKTEVFNSECPEFQANHEEALALNLDFDCGYESMALAIKLGMQEVVSEFAHSLVGSIGSCGVNGLPMKGVGRLKAIRDATHGTVKDTIQGK